MESRHDVTLVVDTDFRARYEHRSMHPETDAEKVRCEGQSVVEVSRRIPGEEASGEYIGVAKFTPAGAASLRDHYHSAQGQTGLERPFRESPTFRQAYLIHLFQEMLDRIDTTTIRSLFNLQVVSEQAPESLQQRRMARRPAALRFTGPNQGAAPAGEEAGKIKTVVRDQPKVGRNELCPCGSGKKYKKCHGINA